MINLVIFASGGGSNALKIIQYFTGHENIKVSAIITNNADAYIVSIAKEHGLPYSVISKKELNNEDYMIKLLEKYKANYLILAGFLLLIPKQLIRNFESKIINIHPSLLPKYGGKGMYGLHIHTAVIDAKEIESGLTIHVVNEEYDKGKVLFQHKVPLLPQDTPKDLAQRILIQEHLHFSRVIESYIVESL
jgi:phosphoribosylglycinamide formyltransferase 1